MSNRYARITQAEIERAIRAAKKAGVPEVEAIAESTPLRLDVAAKLAFPDGSMTASGLRRENRRGRLVIERVAGKDYTTLAYIDAMREQCSIAAKGLACTSDARERTRQASTGPYGSSETAAINTAQAALHTILQGPKRPSLGISPANTPEPQDKSATVIPMKSP
jgi:hypothetical protein